MVKGGSDRRRRPVAFARSRAWRTGRFGMPASWRGRSARRSSSCRGSHKPRASRYSVSGSWDRRWRETLFRAGLRTTVWDRSPAAMAPLADAGSRKAASPEEAVRDARIVITMLPTAHVVTSVMFAREVRGDRGVGERSGMGPDGTIGVAETIEVASRLRWLAPVGSESPLGVADSTASGRWRARAAAVGARTAGYSRAQRGAGPTTASIDTPSRWARRSWR